MIIKLIESTHYETLYEINELLIDRYRIMRHSNKRRSLRANLIMNQHKNRGNIEYCFTYIHKWKITWTAKKTVLQHIKILIFINNTNNYILVLLIYTSTNSSSVEGVSWCGDNEKTPLSVIPTAIFVSAIYCGTSMANRKY